MSTEWLNLTLTLTLTPNPTYPILTLAYTVGLYSLHPLIDVPPL